MFSRKRVGSAWRHQSATEKRHTLSLQNWARENNTTKQVGPPGCTSTLVDNHSSSRDTEQNTPKESHSKEFSKIPVQPLFRCLCVDIANNTSHWFVYRCSIASKTIQILPGNLFFQLLVYFLACTELFEWETGSISHFLHKFHCVYTCVASLQLR